MKSLCTTCGNYEAKVKGKCQSCYHRDWYRANKARPVGPIREEPQTYSEWSAERETRTKTLLALMDPEWVVPDYYIANHKLPNERQIATRKRLQSFQRRTGLKTAAIQRIVGWNTWSLGNVLKQNFYFPPIPWVEPINNALDAYERNDSPSLPT